MIHDQPGDLVRGQGRGAQAMQQPAVGELLQGLAEDDQAANATDERPKRDRNEDTRF